MRGGTRVKSLRSCSTGWIDLPPRGGSRRGSFLRHDSDQELLAWLDEQEAGGVPAHHFRRHRALALAMLGRFDEARAILADVHADLADRGGGIALGTTMGQEEVLVAPLAGDPRAAELGTEACRLLDEQERRHCCQPRRGGSRRRSMRSTGSTRLTTGPGVRRRSAQATTRLPRCSFGRSEPKCSPDAARPRRPSRSRARLWRSARAPT